MYPNPKCYEKSQKEVPENKRIVNIGEKYNSLIVIENPVWYINKMAKVKSKVQFSNFLCDCGTTKWLICCNVKTSRIKSCGCHLIKTNALRERKEYLAKNSLKKCTKCNKEKSINEFHNSSRRKDKKQCECKECMYLRSILNDFNITQEQYYELYNKQNGVCAICHKKSFRKNKETFLCIDHCHETNKIRGLLCWSCNTAIGKLGDNIESIQNVLDYLKNSINKD